MLFVDGNNQLVWLSGVIWYEYFGNIEMDLWFIIFCFQVFNINVGDNDFFYGKVFVSVDVQVCGFIDDFNVDVEMIILFGIVFIVLFLSEEKVIVSEDYIIFQLFEVFVVDMVV